MGCQSASELGVKSSVGLDIATLETVALSTRGGSIPPLDSYFRILFEMRLDGFSKFLNL